ncbi:uncharacterized protein METZ01_LOCUS291646, partial [marine metagenome]
EAAPAHPLHISEETTNIMTALDWCANDTAGATLALRKDRGETQAIQLGDVIGEVGFYSNPVSDLTRPTLQTAGILVCATCNYCNSSGYSHPSEMIFRTTQHGVGTTIAEKMRLTHTGRLGINTINPHTFLHVHEDSPANAYLLVTNEKTGQASYGVVQSLGGIVHGLGTPLSDDTSTSSGTGNRTITNSLHDLSVGDKVNIPSGANNTFEIFTVSAINSIHQFVVDSDLTNAVTDVQVYKSNNYTASIVSGATVLDTVGGIGTGLKVIVTELQEGKPSKVSISDAGSNYSDGDYVKIVQSTDPAICDSCIQIKRTGADGFLMGIDGRQNAKIWNNEDRAIIFGANGCDRFRVSRTGAIGVGVVNSGIPSSLFVNTAGSGYSNGTTLNVATSGGNGS